MIFRLYTAHNKHVMTKMMMMPCACKSIVCATLFTFLEEIDTSRGVLEIVEFNTSPKIEIATNHLRTTLRLYSQSVRNSPLRSLVRR